jgi:hypothetical protein
MKYTFGKTKAAEKLEILLDNNLVARRRITILLSKYTSQLLKITGIKDPDTVRLCMELVKNYTLNRVDIKKTLTPEIRSYVKNIILTRYRAYLHGFNDLVPLIEEMKLRKKKE